jgi:hypothetical protein
MIGKSNRTHGGLQHIFGMVFADDGFGNFQRVDLDTAHFSVFEV